MFLLHPSIFPWDFTILLLLTFSLSGAIACLVWVRRNHKKRIRKIFVGLLGFLGFLGFITVVYGSFIEPRLLIINRYSTSLPLRQPLKIAVISDLHVGPYKEKKYIERVVRETNKLLPDLVLLPGDFIQTYTADTSDLSPLADLRTSLGAFAVLGNHDFGLYRSFFGKRVEKQDRSEDVAHALEEMGITLLRNENILIPLDGGDIAIAGVEDLWTGKTDIAAALAEIPENAIIILLSHNPSIIEDPLSTGTHLIVSGHTHGGQIRLPFIGPIPTLPTTLGQVVDDGLFPVDEDTTLAITRGVGESGPRARLFAWPEIMVIETE